MKLSEIRRILEERQIRLTKSLGQNFLHDSNQISKILTEAKLTSSDRVLEIGPGLGALTEALVKNVNHVLAIEKDKRLFDILKNRFACVENLELVHEDALDFLRGKPHDWHEWKVVSNLPYSVASPIIVELVNSMFPPQLIIVTIQLEVAKRIFAKENTEQYGILGLLIKFWFEPISLFKIPSSCFFPEPEVDSACIILKRRDKPILPQNMQSWFNQVIKQAFAHRRKTIFSNLKCKWSAEIIADALTASGIDHISRAESIDLEKFSRLSVILYEKLK